MVIQVDIKLFLIPVSNLSKNTIDLESAFARTVDTGEYFNDPLDMMKGAY